MPKNSQPLRQSITAALSLLAASAPIATRAARAACPAVGSTQLTYKDVAVVLPAAPADYLTLLSDDCVDRTPPATVVTGKVQLENRATSPQLVECTMGTEKSWDFGRVTLPAGGSAMLVLVATNWSGSLSGQNVTKLSCRNATTDGAGNVSASWIKLLTESVVEANVPIDPAP